VQKLILLLLFVIPITGCIGRKVVYDSASSRSSSQVNKSVIIKQQTVPKTYTEFILSHNRKLDKTIADNISVDVVKYSLANGIDQNLVLALIAKESSFRPGVISSSGAIGLGQLKKETAKDMGVDNPFEPTENVKATTKYLGQLFKKWQGNTELALASYKSGLGTVTKLTKENKALPQATRKYINEIISMQKKLQTINRK